MPVRARRSPPASSRWCPRPPPIETTSPPTYCSLPGNLFDFGVSYFAAKQQADRVLIGDEERRKVIQTLFQDVRRAFWRAASAQRLSHEIAAAIHEAEAALPEARKVETEGLRSPVDSLRYQKALLDLLRQLESIQSVLAVSKTELAQLINLRPASPTRWPYRATTLRVSADSPAPIRKMRRDGAAAVSIRTSARPQLSKAHQHRRDPQGACCGCSPASPSATDPELRAATASRESTLGDHAVRPWRLSEQSDPVSGDRTSAPTMPKHLADLKREGHEHGGCSPVLHIA